MNQMVQVTRCFLCGSRELIHFLSAKDRLSPRRESFYLVTCKGCELCLTSPRPEASELMKYYPRSYEPWARKGRGLFSRRIYSFYYRLTRRLSVKKGQRVLDIGCGNGNFLEYLAAKGAETYGCDLAPSSLGLAPGIRFFQGTLEESHYPSNFFDCVVVWHLLEHVDDPRRTLEEINRILKDDGRFLLSVPNLKGLEPRIFKQASLLLDVPRHLYHFSPEPLEKLLRQTGFRVERKKEDLFMPGPWVKSFFYLLLEDRFSICIPASSLEKISYAGLPISILLNFLSRVVGAGNLLVWQARKASW